MAMLRRSPAGRSSGRRRRLVGVDLKPQPRDRRARVDAAGDADRLSTGDYATAGPFDFIVIILVAHHMTDPSSTPSPHGCDATHGWLINDLHRHSLSFHGFPWLARLIGAHRIVREDGQLSIARAFRPADWREILARAGVPDGAARIERRFPYRLCVERRR